MTTYAQPPVFRQIAAMVFGLIFTFSNGYHGLEFVLSLICAPILFAGVVRLYIGVYRLVRPLVAGCGWGALIAAVIAASAIGVVISFLLVPAFQHSTVLGVILTVVLIASEVFVFVRDVRSWLNIRVEK